MGKRVIAKFNLNSNKNKLFIFLFLLFLTPFISAQPPFVEIGTFTEGYIVEFTPIGTYKLGENIQINAHVLNISNGVRITNSSANCFFHLFNQSGHHTTGLNNFNMSFDLEGLDWELEVLSQNMTSLGEYSYLLNCQSTTGILGGFVAITFEVTQTGFELTNARAIIYFILMLGVFMVFLIILWGAVVLPFKNQRGDSGRIIDIEKFKYLKLGLIFLSYALFIWLLNLFLTLSNSFLFLTQFTGFFTMVFQILINLVFPLFVIMVLTFWFFAWNDLQLMKLLKRGIKPR